MILVGRGHGARGGVLANLKLKNVCEIVEPDHLMTLHLDGRKRPAPFARKHRERSAWSRRLTRESRSEEQQDDHARDVCNDAGSQAGYMISVGL